MQSSKKGRPRRASPRVPPDPRFFRALGEANRVALLVELATAGCAQTVSRVASCCPVDLSVISRHLGTLREAGLLRSEKRGKEVYYRVNTSEAVRRLRALADFLERCCPEEEVP